MSGFEGSAWVGHTEISVCELSGLKYWGVIGGSEELVIDFFLGGWWWVVRK